jgi:hypothetical protein
MLLLALFALIIESYESGAVRDGKERPEKRNSESNGIKGKKGNKLDDGFGAAEGLNGAFLDDPDPGEPVLDPTAVACGTSGLLYTVHEESETAYWYWTTTTAIYTLSDGSEDHWIGWVMDFYSYWFYVH